MLGVLFFLLTLTYIDMFALVACLTGSHEGETESHGYARTGSEIEIAQMCSEAAGYGGPRYTKALKTLCSLVISSFSFIFSS